MSMNIAYRPYRLAEAVPENRENREGRAESHKEDDADLSLFIATVGDASDLRPPLAPTDNEPCRDENRRLHSVAGPLHSPEVERTAPGIHPQ